MARQRTVRTLVKKLYIKEGILRDTEYTNMFISKSAKQEIEDGLGLFLNLVNKKGPTFTQTR
jgi:hypothetical protein